MSSIQGVNTTAATPPVAPKPQPASAAKAPKVEAKETVRDEKNEAARNTQEAGEAKPSGVGSKVNLTA